MSGATAEAERRSRLLRKRQLRARLVANRLALRTVGATVGVLGREILRADLGAVAADDNPHLRRRSVDVDARQAMLRLGERAAGLAEAERGAGAAMEGRPGVARGERELTFAGDLGSVGGRLDRVRAGLPRALSPGQAQAVLTANFGAGLVSDGLAARGDEEGGEGGEGELE